MSQSKRKKYLRKKISRHIVRWLQSGSLTALLILFGAPVFAHHSFPAEFGRSKQGELAGKIVEHWAVSEDRLTINRAMTIYDSYYTKPLARRRGSARRDSPEVFEPAPCDPNGYFHNLLDIGNLEKRLAQ